MKDLMDNLNDRARDGGAHDCIRREAADHWLQAGPPDGISLEWLYDRFARFDAETERRAR